LNGSRAIDEAYLDAEVLLLMAVRSFSQVGEDLLIAYLLGTKRNLRYIDIGCLWPVDHSNTYLFYINGGEGLCIDANPEVATDFKAQRPRDSFLNAAIGAEPGTMLYHVFESPDFNTFSAARAARLIEQSDEKPGRALRKSIEVPLVTLDTALEMGEAPTHPDGRIDFISIDVEGMELEVLKGFSFEPRPRLVVCEQIRRKGRLSERGRDLDDLMVDQGYRQAAYTGHDVFYLDQEPRTTRASA
jgi:FkbM family methyltransferase